MPVAPTRIPSPQPRNVQAYKNCRATIPDNKLHGDFEISKGDVSMQNLWVMSFFFFVHMLQKTSATVQTCETHTKNIVYSVSS